MEHLFRPAARRGWGRKVDSALGKQKQAAYVDEDVDELVQAIPEDQPFDQPAVGLLHGSLRIRDGG